MVELIKRIEQLELRIQALEKTKKTKYPKELDKYIINCIKQIEKRFKRKKIELSLDPETIIEKAQASARFMQDWNMFLDGAVENRPTIYLDGGVSEKYIQFSNIGEYKKTKGQ